ncbi:hypothetical protein HHO41_21275 [Bacillus sp. DNRA2]|uniref:hypothetical protein n=1 Tax=Bacillus sp. DNRA2 TaxID=2723053 RepID=UPI00145F1371|nr:hypothetical protein [Bacillus sp. DNRA2]NMD72761.1 hypothetical protein [Bacillus sp. DNRA2]
MNPVLKKIVRGLSVCYSEVFPNPDTDYFELEYNGKLFIIADSYCMNPDCTCQEAVLNFVQIIPKRGREAESFMIRYKLNGRGYKIHDQGNFNRHELRSIVRHFTSDGMILKPLNERFNEMKEKAKVIFS